MEKIILNIDSRNRNINVNTNKQPEPNYVNFSQNGSNFTLNFDTTYKNIINVKLLSIEYDTEFGEFFGHNYIFLKINDWGYINYLNNKYFHKLLLNYKIDNLKLDGTSNKGFEFRQPTNIKRLDIQLVDYQGNVFNLSEFNFSFTLELTQYISSENKSERERTNLFFNY